MAQVARDETALRGNQNDEFSRADAFFNGAFGKINFVQFRAQPPKQNVAVLKAFAVMGFERPRRVIT